jgi:hypothetical protein
MLRHALFVLILTVVPFCSAITAESGEQATIQRQLLQLVPDPLPAGVTAKRDADFYTSENLYEYMDGGADIFVLYGLHTLLHRDLRTASADITVDIFDMGSPDTAFGMYAAERSSSGRFLEIGVESYESTGVLNFLQDRYYVKLTGFGDGADGALEKLARAISARMGSASAPPALLARLPRENRKLRSEQYIPNDVLGHSFLGPAYVAVYTLDGEESKLFVTVAADAADAKQRLKLLAQNFQKTGHCADAPEFGEGAIRASNSFEGSLIAQTRERYLVFLLNPTASGGQLFKSVLQRLE